MPHLVLPSGTEMFYSIPTCTDKTRALDTPYIDPARPTLLTIHGAASDSRAWVEQIQDPVLNQNFNFVCIDLPFQGLTRTPHDWTPGRQPIPTPKEGQPSSTSPIVSMEKQAEDIVELISKLQLPQMHIVANGVHTPISYYLVLNYPEMWKSAVFLSPASLCETQHNKEQFAELWRAFLDDGEHDEDEVIRGFYSIFFGPRAGPETERRDHWSNIWHTYLGKGDSKHYVFGQWASSIILRKGYSDEQVKNGFKVLICLASGSEHMIHPTAHAEIEAVLRQSTVCPFYESHSLGEAPTMAQITHPKEVNRIICKFVARSEGRRHSVYDAHVTGYNKEWDKPYTYLDAKHSISPASDKASVPKKPAYKSKGLYTLVQAMRRPSTE